jgi:phosphoribosyl 1,2-cyclic phosphodiesterase
MAVKVSVLASGSRGNATFIRTDRIRLLIDAGISRRELAKRLESIGEDPDGIDAVFITHEHNDHACGLRTLIKDVPLTAYLTAGASRALDVDTYERNGSNIVQITPGVTFRCEDVEITPFRVPHDAVEPVAFSITAAGTKITQLTDIGYMPDVVAECLLGSHVLILESNHDLEMLRAGPYPWSLKQRLIGRYGHLSNAAVGRFFREQFDGVAEHILLAHLSSKNNHPELARQETARALQDRGFSTARLMVASQERAMEPLQL